MSSDFQLKFYNIQQQNFKEISKLKKENQKLVKKIENFSKFLEPT
jgi:hypothetical protein